MTTVLVTGGAGYIGRYVVEALRANDIRAVWFDLKPGAGEGMVGDMLDPPALHDAFASFQPDGVIHLAARSSVEESVRSPELYGANAQMCRNLDRMNGGSFPTVLASSAAVYGDQSGEISEGRRCRPVNPYGASKVESEAALPNATCLRLFNVAGGQGAPDAQLLPRVLAGLAEDAPIRLHDDGYCVRDFVHVEDVADAFVAAIEARLRGDPAEVLNICSGQGCTVRFVAALCALKHGRPPRFETADPRPGDPRYLVGDPTRAGRAIGWRPFRSIFDIVAPAVAVAEAA